MTKHNIPIDGMIRDYMIRLSYTMTEHNITTHNITLYHSMLCCTMLDFCVRRPGGFLQIQTLARDLGLGVFGPRVSRGLRALGSTVEMISTEHFLERLGANT